MKQLLAKFHIGKGKKEDTSSSPVSHKYAVGEFVQYKVIEPQSRWDFIGTSKEGVVCVCCIVGLSTARRNDSAAPYPVYALRGLETYRRAPPYGVDPEAIKSCGGGSVCWATDGEILTAVSPQQLTFPLAELPLECLSLIMRHLEAMSSMRVAAEQSLACKKMRTAWLDESSWKLRCSELGFALSDSNSWYQTFRQQRFKVTIVTVWTNMSGTCLSGVFSMYVPSVMTVQQFKSLAASDPRNMQQSASFRPFDGSMINNSAPDEERFSGHKTNCRWNDKDPQVTIQEAGLCNGAVLCQPECMMCD